MIIIERNPPQAEPDKMKIQQLLKFKVKTAEAGQLCHKILQFLITLDKLPLLTLNLAGMLIRLLNQFLCLLGGNASKGSPATRSKYCSSSFPF